MIKIGIDPDTDKSGVAVMKDNEVIKLEMIEFYDLLEFLSDLKYKYDKYIVIIEKGEDNKALFNANKEPNKLKANRIAMNTGRNFETSILLIKHCKRHQIPHKTYAPRTPKMNHQYVSKLVKNMPKRSNEEKRDAIRCCLLG